MENYLKIVLYAYPLLETVEEDYGAHIKNKAVLSYRSEKSADALALYIAEEIVCKDKLVWLRDTVSGVLERLTDGERMMIAIRYFGKQRKSKRPHGAGEQGKTDRRMWSDSKYFRYLKRLSEKVGGMLCAAGLTREAFERDFERMDIFRSIYRFLEAGGDRRISEREKAWLKR